MDVLRDTLRESRGGYFVKYRPADAHLPFAAISVVFPKTNVSPNIARTAMLGEMKFWLDRFAVPVMITSFDATGGVVSISDEFMKSHLMAYVDIATGQVVKRWGTFEQHELPAAQSLPEYLDCVYRDLPSRPRAVVRATARKKAIVQARVLKAVALFMVLPPLLIEVIALGINWVDYALVAISFAVGVWKISKMMGWRKESKREKEEAERKIRMTHYFYHCERNPEAFLRLRNENFEREAVEDTLKEAELLRATGRKASGSAGEPPDR